MLYINNNNEVKRKFKQSLYLIGQGLQSYLSSKEVLNFFTR